MESDLRSCIEFLRGKSAEEVMKYLSESGLNTDNKNLIYTFLFPRPLADKELPTRIMSTRANPDGKLELSPIESILILEASQTAQYGRFIKHLFYSYSDPSVIHPIEGSEICNCCLCGKEIYEMTLWKCFWKQYKPEEEKEKRFLAHGSTETNLPICIPCLINLMKAISLMKEIDPNYLNYGISNK